MILCANSVLFAPFVQANMNTISATTDLERSYTIMNCTHEVERMCTVAKGPNHGAAPIPQEGQWTQVKEISDVSSRCIPFGVEPFGDKCICCGKEAKIPVYWGKAY